MCTELADRDHARTPITLSTNIVDVSGVSLRQFWNLKAHMQAASQLATARYPETLDRIFIIGAPYFFSTVWGWIKRWFDPITVSKIFILSAAEVKPTLETFIDPDNIPKQFGGNLDFKWGDRPNLDPAIRDRATWLNGHQDIPKGPAYWALKEGGKEIELVAVGSVKGGPRREAVCTLPKAFPETKPQEASAVVEVKEEAKGTESAETPANGAVKEPAAPVVDSATEGVQNLSISDDKTATEISEKVLAEETKSTATVQA